MYCIDGRLPTVQLWVKWSVNWSTGLPTSRLAVLGCRVVTDTLVRGWVARFLLIPPSIVQCLCLIGLCLLCFSPGLPSSHTGYSQSKQRAGENLLPLNPGLGAQCKQIGVHCGAEIWESQSCQTSCLHSRATVDQKKLLQKNQTDPITSLSSFINVA